MDLGIVKKVSVVFGLLAILVPAIGSYYTMKNTLDSLSSGISELNDDIKSNSLAIEEIKIKSAVDQSSLLSTRKDVDIIRGDVKELLKR